MLHAQALQKVGFFFQTKKNHHLATTVSVIRMHQLCLYLLPLILADSSLYIS